MWKKILTVSLIFGVSVAGLVLLSLLAFQRFDGYIRYTEAVNDHHVFIKHLDNLRIDLVQVENAERGFLLFNDSAYYKRFYENAEKIKTTFSALHLIALDHPDHRQSVRKLNLLIKGKIDDSNTAMQVGYPPADQQLMQKKMIEILFLIDTIEENEHHLLNEQLAIQKLLERATPQHFHVLFVLAMLVFAVSFGLLIQQYRNRISYQRKLEQNIAELNQVNAEWEQITHVASHDLQEPLRKIRTFTDIIKSKYMLELDADGQAVLNRIDVASARAQSLMTDIVNYTAIVSSNNTFEEVNLNIAVQSAIEDLNNIIAEKSAHLYVVDLPGIRGSHDQMRILFRSLLDNSLKFHNTTGEIRINITYSTVLSSHLPVQNRFSFDEYHRVVIEDNGIGFENQFSERIFGMFQRLHGQDSTYQGRGIGLSMVKRIMTNHMGLVVAKGRPGKGAVFTLYFPVR